MSKARTTVAVCATAAAALVVGASSKSTPNNPLRHGRVTDSAFAKCEFDPFLSCPRGGAEPADEPKKKRKTKRRKPPQASPEGEATDATNNTSSSDTLKEPASQSQQEESTETTAPKDAASQQQPQQQQQPKPETSPVIDEILKQDDFYKILGTTKEAAQSDPNAIKKSYRRRAVQTHPDKTGGDRRAFDKVAEAYDVLSDEQKKATYDRFGKQGLDPSFGAQSNGSAGGFHAEDLFRSFFGGGGGGGSSGRNNPYAQHHRRNRTVRYQLEVTLEDLYQGVERTVLVAPPDAVPGSKTSKRVQVLVPRGSLAGESVVLSGEMDFDPTETPGDLVFWLAQREHAMFTRKGHDLAVAITVSLQEAICGVTRTLRHLDGRKVMIGSARDETQVPTLIQTGDVQVLKGQGMPKDGQGTLFGDLYVQYEVEMPKGTKGGGNNLTEQEREELARLLDKLEGKKSQQRNASDDIQFLTKASLADFGRASGRPQPQQNTESHFEDEGPTGFSPFGGRRQFFYSSSSSNPFFGMNQDGMADQDDGSQCRQM